MLKNIQKFYGKAKRTAILALDNSTKKWFHVFSVIELIPNDLLEYSIPTEDWHLGKIIRSSFASSKELYSIHLVVNNFNTVEEALDLFSDPFKNHKIEEIDNHYFNSSFIQEPTGELPIVLPSNIYSEDSISAVIPKRQSGSFVWSKIDNERMVEELFRNSSLEKETRSMSQLTKDWLGFDIWLYPEHLGNMYLTAPNPYFRDLDTTLSNSPTGIFYRFKMRKGVKEDLKMRVIDTHGDHITMDKTFAIKDSIGIIELPHEPQLVEFRIYNDADDLIAVQGPYTYLKSIEMDMQIKQADFYVNYSDGKDFMVEKFSKGNSIKIGKTTKFNPAYYFKNAENGRKHIKNKSNKDFAFFRGSKDEAERNNQRNEAKKFIVELINQAKYRCIICDPYFGVLDLIEFAFRIQNSGADLKILNAKEHLDKATANSLLEAITEYNKKPFQKINLRVLKGDKSIIHDRFIVSDNNVWFLGTSLNQFGSKATCIARVPKSDDIEIIKEIERLFSNEKYSMKIEDYANSVTTEPS